MLNRIALLLSVSPVEDSPAGLLNVSDVDSREPLRLIRGSFLLTLQSEPGESYSSGELRSVSDNTVYPIRSNRRFLEALRQYLDQVEEPE